MQGLAQLQLSVGWLSLLLKIRVRQKSLIDLSHFFCFVLLDCIEEVAKLVKLSILGRLVRIVQHKRQRGKVKNILFGCFTRFLNAVEQLVLVGQALVPVEVVHDAALATLAQEVEVDLRADRTPLEVEDRRRVLDLLPPLSGINHSLN